MNGVVGYQLLDDGTPLSLGLLLLSGGALFVGTGYIALDTGFSWTGKFDRSLTAPNRNIGLYVLYLLFPLVCLVGFFILETYLVLKVLGEKKPMGLSYLSRPATWTNHPQDILLPRRYCSLSDRCSNTRLAPTSVNRHPARLMVPCSRHSSPYSPSSRCGPSGPA